MTETTARPEVRTQAGLFLLKWDHNGAPMPADVFRDAILAIEQEARSQAVPPSEGLRALIEAIEVWQEQDSMARTYFALPLSKARAALSPTPESEQVPPSGWLREALRYRR